MKRQLILCAIMALLTAIAFSTTSAGASVPTRSNDSGKIAAVHAPPGVVPLVIEERHRENMYNIITSPAPPLSAKAEKEILAALGYAFCDCGRMHNPVRHIAIITSANGSTANVTTANLPNANTTIPLSGDRR